METIIKARAAWVDGRELRQDVALVVSDGTISQIVNASDVSNDTPAVQHDLLLPGFINAHCHLEYTRFQNKLPEGPLPFGDWVASIINLKKATADDDYAEGISQGISQLLAGGCTSVVDSVASGIEVLERADRGRPIRRFYYFEVLGLGDEQAADAARQVEQKLNWVERQQVKDLFLLGCGINPHAPYSVGVWLRAWLRGYLQEHPDLSCAWHLSETEDEELMFLNGSGSIAGFLKKVGASMPFENVPGKTPAAFLDSEGLLERCDMVFHGNFLVPGSESAGPRRTIVHCPPTHRYFQRPPINLIGHMAAGTNVCLGTDSLASGHTLSMLETLRMVAEEFPALSASQLLALVTRNPAMSGPLSKHNLGIIKPGAPADLVALATPTPLAGDLRKTLLAPETKVATTYVAGKVAWTS